MVNGRLMIGLGNYQNAMRQVISEALGVQRESGDIRYA